MITITKERFKAIKKEGVIPEDLLERGITIIMPKNAAQDWLKALRSGEFIQIEGALNDAELGGFCCLGVQQYCQMNGKVEIDEDGSYRGLPTMEYLNKHGIIYATADGVFDNNPYIISEDADVAKLNDDTSYDVIKVNQHATKEVVIFDNNFKRIAKLLEASMAVY